jgi:hypothetical protein
LAQLQEKNAAEEAAAEEAAIPVEEEFYITVPQPRAEFREEEAQTDIVDAIPRWKCRFCGDEHPDHPAGGKKPAKKFNPCNFCGEQNPDHPGRNCPSRSKEIASLEEELISAYESIDRLERALRAAEDAREATWANSTQELFVSEHGQRFHLDRQCRGLRNANRALCKTRCRICG